MSGNVSLYHLAGSSSTSFSLSIGGGEEGGEFPFPRLIEPETWQITTRAHKVCSLMLYDIRVYETLWLEQRRFSFIIQPHSAFSGRGGRKVQMPKKEDEYKKVSLFPPLLWMVMLLMPERTFAKSKESYFIQNMFAFGHHGFRWPMV